MLAELDGITAEPEHTRDLSVLKLAPEPVAEPVTVRPLNPSRLNRILDAYAASEARRRETARTLRRAQTDPAILAKRAEVDRYRREEGRLAWNELRRVRYAIKVYETNNREVRECIRSATAEEATQRRLDKERTRRASSDVKAKNAARMRAARAARGATTVNPLGEPGRCEFP